MKWGVYGDEFFEVEMGLRALLIRRFPGWNPALYKEDLGWVGGDYPVYRIQDDLEAGRPLYLRLAEATQLGPDRQVRLRRGWRARCAEFESLFSVPFDSSDNADRRLTLWQIGLEALQIGWALRFKECVLETEQCRGPRDAWIAALQLWRLHSVAWDVERSVQQEGRRPALPDTERLLKSPEPRSLPPQEAMDDFDGKAAYLERRSEGLDLPENASPSEKRMIAEWRLWCDAGEWFAEVVRSKLHGLDLVLTGTRRERGAIRFEGGYTFQSPEARIWFGFWADLCGVHCRTCANPRCEARFVTARRDRVYCGERCRNAARQANYRRKQRESRRGLAATRTSAVKGAAGGNTHQIVHKTQKPGREGAT